MIDDAMVVIRFVPIVRVVRVMVMVMDMGLATMIVLVMVADGGMVGVPVFFTMGVRHQPRCAHGRQGDNNRHNDRRVEPRSVHSG